MSFNKFVIISYDGGIKEVFCLQVTNRDNVDYKTEQQRKEIAASVTKDYANCAAGVKAGIDLGPGPFATGNVNTEVVKQMEKFKTGWVNPCGFGKVDPVEFILEKNDLTASEWRLNIMNFKPCSNSAKCHPRNDQFVPPKYVYHKTVEGKKDPERTVNIVGTKKSRPVYSQVNKGKKSRAKQDEPDPSSSAPLTPPPSPKKTNPSTPPSSPGPQLVTPSPIKVLPANKVGGMRVSSPKKTKVGGTHSSPSKRQ
ncbi:hypothetical protein FDP41_007065 [Naegleria fowleri]|uniref:Uncharacterized protein n=1 Tax=Naegleria fowleri TaxID=5763 RepID=A0A6A5BI01_NAEFO|nr:uncharacterized protein FDP41_007065 [Naegleria fowleri]KAF0973678.1 hypothetical protein FDP41_007065 [Naegleria fowleri]